MNGINAESTNPFTITREALNEVARYSIFAAGGLRYQKVSDIPYIRNALSTMKEVIDRADRALRKAEKEMKDEQRD